jgi:serine/threonine-protein kinase
LGEGGMGAVYKGVDTMLDREVAIKALRPELASQTAVVERFRSEAVTLAKLHHPNIATLYSLFRQTDELYMVLEYVKGETLDSILQRRGALPSEEVIPVFCQILDGINHAHEFGIVHRDIKPANMMLTEKGTLKVLDFGIARLLGSNRMTRAGNIIGTLEYMAPEQVKGQETDARTDIYALGMMLYEVLTGRLPFSTDNEFELMKLQTEGVPESPRSINPLIPEEVAAAIMCSIQKNPDHRFQTAGEFREALLDAGFAAQGSMRRNTGPRASRGNTNPPTERLNSGEQSLAEAGRTDSIKETRLGMPDSVSQPVQEIKETRLGGNAVSQTPEFLYEPESPSVFSNLTWTHYAAAGSGVAVIIALLIIIPVVLFGGAGEPIKKSVEVKPTAVPTVEKLTPTPLTPNATPQTSAASQSVTQPEPMREINVTPIAPIETVSATGGASEPAEAPKTTKQKPTSSSASGGKKGSAGSTKGGLTAAQKRKILERVLSQ